MKVFSRQTFYLAAGGEEGAICGEEVLGLRPIEVSIQPPHEHPAPPSGIRSMPWAGIVFSQQLGRIRMKRDTDPVSLFHRPSGELPSPRIRNMRAFFVATTVEQPRRGP